MKSKKILCLLISACFIVLSFCSCSGNLEIDKKTEDKLSYEITEENTVKITGYVDTTTVSEIAVPDEIDGLPVTEICDFSMFNSESLKKIIIGKNVEKIGSWAFTNNQSLECFQVSNENQNFVSVNGILFSKNMETLLFYPSAKNIKFNKFGEAQNKTSYDIPNGVETIRSKAFYKCYYVEHITIPDSVKVIEEKAFHRCTALTSINLPTNLQLIGKDAFAYCSLIESVTIPENVKEIQEYAFFNCSKITQVNMKCKQDEVTLGNKWFPTSNGKQVKDCNINWM